VLTTCRLEALRDFPRLVLGFSSVRCRHRESGIEISHAACSCRDHQSTHDIFLVVEFSDGQEVVFAHRHIEG